MNLLTERQLRFARCIAVENMPASKAYVAAGYAEKACEPNSSRLIRVDKVAREIERLREARDTRILRTADDVMIELWKLLDSERDRLGALNTLAKIYGLTKDGLTVNIDARNQVAQLTDAQLVDALSAASQPTMPLIEGEAVPD